MQLRITGRRQNYKYKRLFHLELSGFVICHCTLSCKEVDGTTFEVYKEDAAVAAYNTYVDVVKDYNLNDEKSAELYDVVQDAVQK